MATTSAVVEKIEAADVAPTVADTKKAPKERQVRKHTPRSPELKKSITCRLNRAIGQLNGVKKMVDENRYCGDVLTQLAAAESAVKAVSRMVMEDHLHTCVIEKIQDGDTEVVDEVMDLLKKFGA